MAMNTWKDVAGYEGIYKVSPHGEIYSIKNRSILSPCVNNKGYSMVILYKRAKPKHMLVHRIVALSYIPNVDNLPQVNHIDGNKRNNNITNLEWCSNGSNQIHRIYTLGQPVVTRKGVIQIKDGVVINSFSSGMEASRKTGICRNSISMCCIGKYNTAGGYQWKFNSKI